MVFLRIWPISAALATLSATYAAAQCDEPHYRWTEKTDESLASMTGRRTAVALATGTVILLTQVVPPERQTRTSSHLVARPLQ